LLKSDLLKAIKTQSPNAKVFEAEETQQPFFCDLCNIELFQYFFHSKKKPLDQSHYLNHNMMGKQKYIKKDFFTSFLCAKCNERDPEGKAYQRY
jgi:hypothetical protein